VSKSQNDISAAKRDGYDMTTEVMYSVQLDRAKSSKRATMTIMQEPFLDELDKTLDEDENEVIKEFEALRAECSPKIKSS